jgi:hypothetical protein
MQYVIGETTATGWAFFHSLVLLHGGSRATFSFHQGF